MTRFRLYRDAKGEYRWQLISRHGQTIARGGDAYATRQYAEQVITEVQEQAPDAEIVDLTDV